MQKPASTRKKKNPSGFKFILIVLCSIPILLFYYKSAINRPGPGGSSVVTFTIEPGEGVDSIAQSLYQNKIINSTLIFKLYVIQTNSVSKLQAGNYYLQGDLPLTEVVNNLRLGILDTYITFLEGWRREEMAQALDKVGDINITGDDFLAFSKGMEGYLFPDTYAIAPATTAQDLVDLMSSTLSDNLSNELTGGINSQGLSLEEAVNIASIVEREARSEESKAIVAGILIKRFQNDWALQADATSQYDIGTLADWWPKDLEKAVLDTESKYNTRDQLGLPPTPICNPGLKALEAVAFPKTTNYWFYISDKEGKMHYAETIEKHTENIKKYL